MPPKRDEPAPVADAHVAAERPAKRNKEEGRVVPRKSVRVDTLDSYYERMIMAQCEVEIRRWRQAETLAEKQASFECARMAQADKEAAGLLCYQAQKTLALALKLLSWHDKSRDVRLALEAGGALEAAELPDWIFQGLKKSETPAIS